VPSLPYLPTSSAETGIDDTYLVFIARSAEYHTKHKIAHPLNETYKPWAHANSNHEPRSATYQYRVKFKIPSDA
jgi:hypothetical protein